MNSNLEGTQYNIDIPEVLKAVKEEQIKKDLTFVYEALCEKGYNPISQLIGYILTEDPTYITSHNGARKLACRLDRYEILEVLLKQMLQEKSDDVHD